MTSWIERLEKAIGKSSDTSFQRKYPPQLPESPRLTVHYVCGEMEAPLCFVDEERNIRKTIVQIDHTIRNFPGIVEEDFWTSEISSGSLEPRVRYRMDFSKRGSGWRVIWTVQPDGRYWEDEDGYGAEDDQEIMLYTDLDQNGDFTGPFRVYQIGIRPYTLERFEDVTENRYRECLRKLKEGNLRKESGEDPENVLFPRLSNNRHFRSGRDMLWDRKEALDYWGHPLLSKRLLEATEVLMQTEIRTGSEHSDEISLTKIHESMTLFWLVTRDSRFQAVLDRFFGGKLEASTKKQLENTE